MLRWFERIMLTIERPVNRLVGVTQLNPFYYTGPIAVFLLGVVFITGAFLVFFFQVGFDVSYLFVARIESQVVARVVRAMHRYASDALVIVSLIHAFRLFVLNRLRGARWLAWVSGVVMMMPILFAGITGYWLIWDERALAITVSFDNILQRGASSIQYLSGAMHKGNDWIFIMIVLVAHLAFSVVVGVALWIHVARLQRPKWLPNNTWLAGLTIVLLVVAIVAPVGMLPRADLRHPPNAFPIDLIYLAYLPIAFNEAWNVPWVWLLLLAVFIVAVILPWLPPQPRLPPQKKTPRLEIDKARCTGCTFCAIDCPYNAITMESRNAVSGNDESEAEGKSPKRIAVAHPNLCVACGICLGACEPYAITLGELSTEALWRALSVRIQREPERSVVLTCERHAAQNPGAVRDAIVVVLPCVGAAHPDLVGRAVEAGAKDVRVIGCPPEDCANREGNEWEEGRVTRKRSPRLKRTFASDAISLFWRAPDEFSRALKASHADEWKRKLTWRNLVPAFLLLVLVLLAQIWLTNVMFKP